MPTTLPPTKAKQTVWNHTIMITSHTISMLNGGSCPLAKKGKTTENLKVTKDKINIIVFKSTSIQLR